MKASELRARDLRIMELWHEGKTLQAIGDASGGITRERVRQIIARECEWRRIASEDAALLDRVRGFVIEHEFTHKDGTRILLLAKRPRL